MSQSVIFYFKYIKELTSTTTNGVSAVDCKSFLQLMPQQYRIKQKQGPPQGVVGTGRVMDKKR